MDQLPLVLLLFAAVGVAAGVTLVRASGSRISAGRRLAGASASRVGDLLDAASLPDRPIRVSGRVRCPDPMVTESDDRLVALHRDVEVRLGDGRWRPIERLRETRGMELWDHDGSLPLDLAEAAEPLVAIPHVWRGTVSELTDAAHAAAVARLEQEGLRPGAARSVTRSISVVDRLLVLARPVRTPDGGVALAPPRGGYVVSALELPDAMRLLGGPRRGWLLAGAALIGAGTLAALVAILVLALGAFA
jgi:hypothetical protein